MIFVSEFICRVVIAAEVLPNDSRLNLNLFETYAAEWDFLVSYYETFAQLPNEATFREQFPQFPWKNEGRTAQWLLDELLQQQIELTLTADIQALQDRLSINPRDAARTLHKLAASYESSLSMSADTFTEMNHGNAEADRVLWRSRMDDDRIAGVTNGFPLLDNVTYGTQRGEIEIYFARPGEGKSFILLHGAIAACRAGFNVSYVSPEMNLLETKARYYAMMTNVSASRLFSGRLSEAEFAAFSDRLSMFNSIQSWGFLRFREMKGRSGRFTTRDLANLVRSDKPDIIIVDGLLLIDPVRSDNDPRKRIISLMDEVKTLTTNTEIPIRFAHQANRKSEIEGPKKKDPSIDDSIPDLIHLAESGAVEQYANRVYAIKKRGIATYIALRKNRNMETGRIISFQHDIDRGVFSENRLVQASESMSEHETSLHYENADPNANLPF